jgi:hypothetical protein
MCVTAMVGLVVEPVVERGRQLLHELFRRRDPAVTDHAGQPRLVETVDVGNDAPVLGLARRPEVGQALVHDGVEPIRRLTLAGEAFHPDAIGGEQMVQRAVHRLEERAFVGAILAIGQEPGGIVETAVRPGVVAGEGDVVVFHAGIVDPCRPTSRLIGSFNHQPR